LKIEDITVSAFKYHVASSVPDFQTKLADFRPALLILICRFKKWCWVENANIFDCIYSLKNSDKHINPKILNDVQVLGASGRVRPLAPSCASRTALRATRPPSAHSWRPSRRAANWRPNSGRPKDRLVKQFARTKKPGPEMFLSRRSYLSSRTIREGILAKEVNKLTKFELEKL
jgi:hypothetical protein